MNRNDNRLPFRHATRLVNVFQHDIGALGRIAVGPDLDGAALLLALLRSSLRDRAAPHVSIHAVAVSLKRSPETVRRAALRLVGLGYCEKSARHIRLHSDVHGLANIVQLERSIATRFVRLLDEFQTAAFELPRGIYATDEAARTVAALDIFLAAFELSEARIIQPMLLQVVGTVTIMNAARLTRDPALGLRYGYDHTVPPDDMRDPASVRAIAAECDLPYATVWRHVVGAQRDDLIRSATGGYLLSDRLINNAAISLRSRTKIKYVRRVLTELADGKYAERFKLRAT